VRKVSKVARSTFRRPVSIEIMVSSSGRNRFGRWKLGGQGDRRRYDTPSADILASEIDAVLGESISAF
jgi:hypothetical protein